MPGVAAVIKVSGKLSLFFLRASSNISSSSFDWVRSYSTALTHSGILQVVADSVILSIPARFARKAAYSGNFAKSVTVPLLECPPNPFIRFLA